jgi:GxxExxY protein
MKERHATFDPDKAQGAISDPQTYTVIGAAQKVHRVLGPGFKESTYEQALRLELSELSVPFCAQPEYTVCYNNHACGTYIPDIVTHDRIVLELKAVAALSPDHVAQTVSYLRVTNLPVALLLNFGQESLEFRRFENKQASNPTIPKIPKSPSLPS